jgi:3-hydroxybutyrate dehydrogenase
MTSTDAPINQTDRTADVVRLDLSGHTAVVTGAASGIGRAVATRLGRAGAKVVVIDINAEAVERIALDIGGTPMPADLSRANALDAFDGDCSVVVNCAGIQHVAPVEDFPIDRFAYIQQVMVEAPFRLTQRALPSMYARGWGRVVNISSVHGLRASPFKAAYVAAKHGLEGLTKVVALEGAAHGVTANCVNPGYVRTPLVEGQIAQQAQAHGVPEAEVLEQILLTRSAIKRLIEPHEVSELVAYLCTAAADFITGASITLDGGWTAS